MVLMVMVTVRYYRVFLVFTVLWQRTHSSSLLLVRLVRSGYRAGQGQTGQPEQLQSNIADVLLLSITGVVSVVYNENRYRRAAMSLVDWTWMENYLMISWFSHQRTANILWCVGLESWKKWVICIFYCRLYFRTIALLLLLILQMGRNVDCCLFPSLSSVSLTRYDIIGG